MPRSEMFGLAIIATTSSCATVSSSLVMGNRFWNAPRAQLFAFR